MQPCATVPQIGIRAARIAQQAPRISSEELPPHQKAEYSPDCCLKKKTPASTWQCPTGSSARIAAMEVAIQRGLLRFQSACIVSMSRFQNKARSAFRQHS